jgi:hypothetical protein
MAALLLGPVGEWWRWWVVVIFSFQRIIVHWSTLHLPSSFFEQKTGPQQSRSCSSDLFVTFLSGGGR